MMHSVKIEIPCKDVTQPHDITNTALISLLRALHTLIDQGWPVDELMRSITIDGYTHNFMMKDHEELEEYIYNMMIAYVDTGLGITTPVAQQEEAQCLNR